MSHHAPDRLNAAGLEAFLHEQIPLSLAMGVRVAESSGHRLVLEAPLAPNRNHLGKAFGGSLHTLPVLACYSALWLLVREAGYESHVVIRRSTIKYHLPVGGTLRAICERPPADTIARFLTALKRNKKARLELRAVVAGPADEIAADFTGDFVAVL